MFMQQDTKNDEKEKQRKINRYCYYNWKFLK